MEIILFAIESSFEDYKGRYTWEERDPFVEAKDDEKFYIVEFRVRVGRDAWPIRVSVERDGTPMEQVIIKAQKIAKQWAFDLVRAVDHW